MNKDLQDLIWISVATFALLISFLIYVWIVISNYYKVSERGVGQSKSVNTEYLKSN